MHLGWILIYFVLTGTVIEPAPPPFLPQHPINSHECFDRALGFNNARFRLPDGRLVNALCVRDY